MKTLCLFANCFPYGKWEPYLETEIEYYKGFDKVYIFALQLRRDEAKSIRPVPSNFFVIPINYAPKWVYLINCVRILFQKHLYKELIKIISSKEHILKRIVSLFVFMSRSYYERNIILKVVPHEDIKDAVMYSYRYEYQPYLAYILRKKLKGKGKLYSRAHRFDLYANKRSIGYIPLREYILEKIDNVFPCSNDGTRYLQSLYPKFKDKIQTRYLGTLNFQNTSYTRTETFRIVSCSNIVPVKRLNLLLNALKEIRHKKIHWTHFGGGALDELITAGKDLPMNISIDFRGNVPNKELIKIYQKENFDLFVNVSESEGIPVSIMEAMSFEIPCLATNAGGTGEIVENGNGGWLIPVESTAEEIARIIEYITDIPLQDYMVIRHKAKNKWNINFNSDINYSSFVKEISN